MKLNENQKKAVEHITGPMMVLAGPGSGKTAVITERIKYLCLEQGADPRTILVITFTKAAAIEMEARFLKLTGNKYDRTNFSTFHSFFFKILKAHYNYNASNIATDKEQSAIIRTALEKESVEYDDMNELTGNIISEISLIKSNFTDLNKYSPVSCDADVFKRVYSEYLNEMKIRRLIDFDDMMTMCYSLLKNHEKLLKMYQNHFQYILIDEFQDINPIQFEIIKMIAYPKNNLFIVGDDDQSIYRFRGSSPEIMLNFTKIYPDAKVVYLNRNYRSTKSIVDTASRLIMHNSRRFKKNLSAENSEDVKIKVFKVNTSSKQNRFIVNEIQRLVKKGYSFNDMAVLFRNNSQSMQLFALLSAYNIPFKAKDFIPNIFSHFISSHILAYIRCALSFHNEGILRRKDFLIIMNRPLRYVSRTALDGPVFTFQDLFNYYEDKTYMLDRLFRLRSDLESISRLNPEKGINYILKVVGYEDFLKEQTSENHMDFDEYRDIIDELLDLSSNFTTYEEFFKYIEDYENRVVKSSKIENSNSVSMLTYHSSKGLEFEIVFLIDVIEDFVPHKKAISPEDIEEERRLFYVALTRAKRHIYIMIPAERKGKKKEESRFVRELF